MNKVLIHPDDRLREKALPIEEFNSSLEDLANEMYSIMKKSRGIGLAATQINEHKRLIVIQLTKKQPKLILCNPTITSEYGKQLSPEGCLSVPKISASVKRVKIIDFEFNTLRGVKVTQKASGLLAACIQHEIDHLNGVLFIDHLKGKV